MTKIIQRIRTLIKQTDNTSIVPIKYAIPLAICSFIALWALPERTVESSDPLIVEAVSEVTYPMNPIGIQDLSADMHDTEEWVPSVNVRSVEVKPTITTTTTTLAPVITTTTTVAPVATTQPSSDAKCPEWWDLALEVGWTEEDLPHIDRIMWAESRCEADAVSPTKDYGLMQVNRAVWRDYVEARGYVMDDLLDPRIGLTFGLYVAQEAEAMGWCRFQPWYMSGNWC